MGSIFFLVLSKWIQVDIQRNINYILTRRKVPWHLWNEFITNMRKKNGGVVVVTMGGGQGPTRRKGGSEGRGGGGGVERGRRRRSVYNTRKVKNVIVVYNENTVQRKVAV